MAAPSGHMGMPCLLISARPLDLSGLMVQLSAFLFSIWTFSPLAVVVALTKLSLYDTGLQDTTTTFPFHNRL